MRLPHDNSDPQLRKWKLVRVMVRNACVSRLAFAPPTAGQYVNPYNVCWRIVW